MIVRSLSASEQPLYDSVVSHPLQSYAWGEFRRLTGTQVERVGVFDQGKLVNAFSLTFHPVPHTSYTVGYYPKGKMPDEQSLKLLEDLGHKYNALYIKLEPNIAATVGTPNEFETVKSFLRDHHCIPGKALFTPYTFQLDLRPTEEELLANMHQKTRYNINLAERKGVQIIEDTSVAGLQEYLKLMAETTKRQGFYAHSDEYYTKMFETMSAGGMLHIFKAVMEGQTLSVWIIFVFNGKLYYPYGASSREHREVMANNLLAWKVIQFGKKAGCETFDMWGSLGPNPDQKDPWYGFHKFKEGYGGKLVEFVGSYDLVINPQLYPIFQFIDKLRWKFLRLKSRFA